MTVQSEWTTQECKDLTAPRSYITGITRHVLFLLYGLGSIVRGLSYIQRPHRYTRQYQAHRLFNGDVRRFSKSRWPRCANTDLLRSAGKFSKQLPTTIITAGTIDSQCYKLAAICW
jgi:hypothetical protein